MSFARTRYLSWYLPRAVQEDVIHLDASGVPSLVPEQVPPAKGDPWAMASHFERSLAAWLGIAESRVLFTPGGTGGTLLALLTLVDQGQEIVVESPVY